VAGAIKISLLELIIRSKSRKRLHAVDDEGDEHEDD
jgi:hypothetical protein